MADGNVMKQVKTILDADLSRRFVVVSAPGKRYSGDSKVTDMLYSVYEKMSKNEDWTETFDGVKKRMEGIVRELNINFDITSLLVQTKEDIERIRTIDFIASRGEYLCAHIMAKLLNATFIDSADVVFFNAEGRLDSQKTYKAVSLVVQGVDRAVFSGFYGTDVDGNIKTFSRGGSDISGAIIARAVGASVYENWTDVSGFLACDPHIVKSPKRIKYLSYKELRELSYMGANVLHSESIFPVLSAGIPIYIKNTFSPEDAGTCIVPPTRFVPSGDIVTGIAGKKDFSVILLEKSMMNEEVGILKKVLGIFESFGISVEHVPTGIDTMSILFESKYLADGKVNALIDSLKEQIKPDSVRITEGIALIATVGHGMSSNIGTSARVFKALADAGVNVNMIDSGSSELNLIVGVRNEDCDRAIKAIYYEFFNN